MTISGIVLVLTLLIGGLASHLQREEISIRRALPQIDSVAFLRSDGSRRLQIKGRFAEDCAAPLQSAVKAFPHNLDIQLYRDIASTVVCDPQETPFEYDLPVERGTDRSAVIINDRVWLAERAAYFEASLFPAWLDQALLIQADSGGLQLRLRGAQAVGCLLPELFTWRETSEGIFIGVYNAMDAAEVCPAVEVEIVETVSLPATELPADTLLRVNDILISESETQNVSDIDKVMTNINRVDVTVAGERISLAIEGEHPDGCDYPVQVDQRRDGNIVHVEIYREVPADVFCPMILQPYQATIQLDGSFTAGSYTINVNSHSQTLEI